MSVRARVGVIEMDKFTSFVPKQFCVALTLVVSCIVNLNVLALDVTVYPTSTPKVLLTTVKLAAVELDEKSHTKILHEHIAKHFMTPSTVSPRFPLIPPASILPQIALRDEIEYPQQFLRADGIT